MKTDVALLKQPKGIFESIVIEREITNLATGQPINSDFSIHPGDVLEIGKEALLVKFKSGWHIRNEEGKCGHFIKILNFYNHGLDQTIPGASISLKDSSIDDCPRVYIKNENGTVEEYITSLGDIFLNVDLDRLTDHKIKDHIGIYDNKGEDLYAKKFSCNNPNDSIFYYRSDIPVKRLDFLDFNGGYEVGEGDNKYIIPTFVSKAQLKSS